MPRLITSSIFCFLLLITTASSAVAPPDFRRFNYIMYKGLEKKGQGDFEDAMISYMCDQLIKKWLICN
ncbi:hypothetical protein SASPL_148288 [Salvia splendens]|uniref:Uncharacterized protein n=1 Tax=Salvia splendens TaxID=180675 RepID=A0A8X8W9G3_SALSN|nr:hypothetical protein SASPL_148288 [Salvia splendens]